MSMSAHRHALVGHESLVFCSCWHLLDDSLTYAGCDIVPPCSWYVLQDDKAMFLFADDDETYQEQSLPGTAPARGEGCIIRYMVQQSF